VNGLRCRSRVCWSGCDDKSHTPSDGMARSGPRRCRMGPEADRARRRTSLSVLNSNGASTYANGVCFVWPAGYWSGREAGKLRTLSCDFSNDSMSKAASSFLALSNQTHDIERCPTTPSHHHVRDDRLPSKQAARRAPSNSAVASAAWKAPPPVTPSAGPDRGYPQGRRDHQGNARSGQAYRRNEIRAFRAG
jgi:hypothetical protein